jgi:hypothetical protein
MGVNPNKTLSNNSIQKHDALITSDNQGRHSPAISAFSSFFSFFLAASFFLGPQLFQLFFQKSQLFSAFEKIF